MLAHDFWGRKISGAPNAMSRKCVSVELHTEHFALIVFMLCFFLSYFFFLSEKNTEVVPDPCTLSLASRVSTRQLLDDEMGQGNRSRNLVDHHLIIMNPLVGNKIRSALIADKVTPRSLSPLPPPIAEQDFQKKYLPPHHLALVWIRKRGLGGRVLALHSELLDR